MKFRLSVIIAVLLLSASGVHSQQGTGHHHVRPYASLGARDVKALSDAQLADLLAGRGMGLVLATDLNGQVPPRPRCAART